VTPAEAERIYTLQARIDAIRGIAAATTRTELRGILADMLADGERALAVLKAKHVHPG
jgi:hypothetical protein